MKRIKKRVLSILCAVAMIFTIIPLAAFATEDDYVYISVSEENEFIKDTEGKAVAYTPVPLDSLTDIDLNEYGLSDYIYDSDGDGKQDITALHLFIHTHERILGLDWNDVDPHGGSPASMYFTSGLFGFEDENLRYNYNGRYPADENGWGVTADNIVLSPGDYMEVAHFSDFYFYMDSAYGFRYFADENNNTSIHFNAEVDNPFGIKLNRIGGGMGWEEFVIGEPEAVVYYGQSIGNELGTVITDIEGYAEITFPSAGIWYLWSDSGVGVDAACDSVVTPPASATVTVTGNQQAIPEEPRQAQDVSGVLNATLAKLAATVTEPGFGTNAGEWTVLCLARGEYYAKDNAYFKDYYSRIVEYVNTKAAGIDMNGALHKKKSTDNSRLIVALSSIGKDATAVGNWNLTTPYEDFEWIKNQGINGSIWTLIALDSNNYETKDTTIRQQCIDQLLDMELETGGWPLTGGAFDNDITAMALQALYPYRDQPEVAAAVERAFDYLSEIQLETGGFLYGNAETSESAAQVIVACTTWGINPDTDKRFMKNGNSVVDNLLTYYVEDEAMFAHQGTEANDMATDQACYALVAYNRFMNEKTSLYDMSDVIFDEKPESTVGKLVATLGLPEMITNEIGKEFNVTVNLEKWDNEAEYKMIDFMMKVPEGLGVAAVTAGKCLKGGEASYNLDADTGKLRVVYFDANGHSDLTVDNTNAPASLFTVTFYNDGLTKEGYIGHQNTKVVLNKEGDQCLNIELSGMSIKRTSDSADEDSMVIVDSTNAAGTIIVVNGLSYSAVCLYTGDDIDLIPSDKKAVAVSVVGGGDTIDKLSYKYNTYEYEFKYSEQLSEATKIPTYIALVDASIEMQQFVLKQNFIMTDEETDTITFGDANGDGVINAQDALTAVDTWLRKEEAPSDDGILALNVNGDSRINTFDALGMVEVFVNGTEHVIVTKVKSLNNTIK